MKRKSCDILYHHHHGLLFSFTMSVGMLQSFFFFFPLAGQNFDDSQSFEFEMQEGGGQGTHSH